ncbi:MAG: ribonuclease J [Anaerolineales bacterium]|nr:ribonuclease J [Anaerolineales bacterium]
MNKHLLRIIPLGGLGEVGKNMMAVEYGGKILVIDAGIMFPENDMLGIDYIIPDFQYLVEKRHKVCGIVVTHGHEDHTGAICHVLEQINAPIYATPLTSGLLDVKISRCRLQEMANLHTIQAGDSVNIGPFHVEFFHVSHSIPDSIGLAITTPAGLIVHSGDYKFDHTPVDNWPTDYAKLAELSGRGVLALLADSTNAEKHGWTPSERVIDPALDQVFRTAPGRVIVATFASLVSRMQQVGIAAAHNRRKLAFVGTGMNANAKMASKLGYLDLPDDVLVSVEHALDMPPARVVLMCTGSQGEPSSILGRLSTGQNRQFDLMAGDTVVLSSHPIPGNEETVYKTINRLFARGANVIYEAIAPVHVSGHANQEEMKLLMQLVRPKYLIPIHGELRQLHQHAALGREVGIPDERIAVVENGQVIEFRDGKMRLGERLPGGYVFVDGSGVGDVDASVMRERESLARDGFVLVNFALDRKSGRLREEPEIITRGFVHERDSSDLLAGINRLVAERVKSNVGSLEDDLKQAVRTYLYNETKRRPEVFIILTRL